MGERTDLQSQALEFLPLKPIWFQMLLVLAGGVRHGYAIRREVEQRTDGAVRLWPTTLYGSLSKMEEAGLIEEVEDAPADGDDDIDRVFYRLTALGRTVLLVETERLEELVRLSRTRTSAAGRA